MGFSEDEGITRYPYGNGGLSSQNLNSEMSSKEKVI